MPSRHKPRRNKQDARLLRQQQVVTGQTAQILDFPGPASLGASGNEVPQMPAFEMQEVSERIRRRYWSAEPATRLAAEEIDRSERQFKGLFPDQPEDGTFEDDDDRIFMKKTLEHAVGIYAHLDSLTSQLNPLLVFKPSPQQLYPGANAYRRAKLKEILVNQYLTLNKFREKALSRWRWNFLKHPSAYLRVLYDADRTKPDIAISVVDRGDLFIDPTLMTADVRDSGWIIERFRITAQEADEMIREGHWALPAGILSIKDMTSPVTDSVMRRLLGNRSDIIGSQGPEEDEQVEGFHYFQTVRRGQPHAYGVVLGGIDGHLVRWGSNPFAYKGIPHRGKAYLPDVYSPDGMSMNRQYRHIQETYNTFLNLRIADVLEGVKRQFLVLENIFDENTHKDVANDQRFIRGNSSFGEQILEQGRKLGDFMEPLGSGDSTQHLLQDLQFLGGEGEAGLHITDTFQGKNPQAGATLGQYQEQLFRALGAFRPIFSAEMQLIEEVGEIIAAYFDDEEFFGADRIASIVGPNRYKETIQGFHEEPGSGMAVLAVQYDEMDVDVTVDAVNQAEHLASRTLRTTSVSQFLEALRHHPKLTEEAEKSINFTALFTRYLQDMGEDIEAITYTEEQKKQRAQQKQQEKQEALKEQVAVAEALESAKAKGRALGERERSKGRIAETQARVPLETRARVQEKLAELAAQHRFRITEMQEEFEDDVQKMFIEADLERDPSVEGVGHGSNINRA